MPQKSAFKSNIVLHLVSKQIVLDVPVESRVFCIFFVFILEAGLYRIEYSVKRGAAC